MCCFVCFLLFHLWMLQIFFPVGSFENWICFCLNSLNKTNTSWALKRNIPMPLRFGCVHEVHESVYSNSPHFSTMSLLLQGWCWRAAQTFPRGQKCLGPWKCWVLGEFADPIKKMARYVYIFPPPKRKIHITSENQYSCFFFRGGEGNPLWTIQPGMFKIQPLHQL